MRKNCTGDVITQQEKGIQFKLPQAALSNKKLLGAKWLTELYNYLQF